MRNTVTIAALAAPSILFSALLGSGGGCSSEHRCSYGNQSYPEGASFRATDGCNTCTCAASGQVDCTLVECLGDAGFEPPPDLRSTEARDTTADARLDLPLPIDAAMPDTLASAPDQDYCRLQTGLTFYVQQEIRIPNSPASYSDRYRVDSDGLVITRDWWNGYDAEYQRTCSPLLAPCGSGDQVTVWNIGADLADPEVKAAFASTPPTFGAAKWPSDAWSIASDDGGRIFVGLPCPSGDSTCRLIPPGLQRLRDDLQALAAAGAAQETCATLLQP